MSIADGQKIGIKFTQTITSDISTLDTSAFTISGQEYNYVPGGVLANKEYEVDSAERHPIVRLWDSESALQLDAAGELSITDSKCYEVTSNTTLTGTVSANSGDIVLATISHRSTFTTPVGWTKLYETAQAFGSFNQKMVFAVKEIDATGTVSFTATQSSAGRIYINLISVSGISRVELESNYEEVLTSVATQIQVPNKTAGEKLIWGVSASLWVVSNYGQWQTSPNDLELLQLPSTTQPRQLNAIDNGSGQSTDRIFTPNSGTGTEMVAAAVRLVRKYSTPKTSTTEAIEMSGEVRIKWTEDKPEDTDIVVEYTTGEEQGEWQTATDGGIIEVGTNLWIKVTLTTEDTSVTPTLSALWLEEPTVPDDKILLTVADTENGFRNVVGDLTVAYNSMLGNLSGAGGSVPSFSEAFTPESLVRKPDIHEPAHIDVSIAAEGDLIRIYYSAAQDDEDSNIEIVSITASGTLTNINDL